MLHYLQAYNLTFSQFGKDTHEDKLLPIPKDTEFKISSAALEFLQELSEQEIVKHIEAIQFAATAGGRQACNKNDIHLTHNLIRLVNQEGLTTV